MAKSMKKVHIYRRNTALGALNTINIFVFMKIGPRTFFIIVIIKKLVNS